MKSAIAAPACCPEVGLLPWGPNPRQIWGLFSVGGPGLYELASPRLPFVSDQVGHVILQ